MSPFHCVVFTLSNHKFALPLACVERVVSAVEVTLVPDAPDTIAGVINVHGQIVPVIDLRSRLHSTGRNQLKEDVPGIHSGNHAAEIREAVELELNDQLIIARNGENLVAIVANAVDEVGEYDQADIVASPSAPGSHLTDEHIHGIIATGDDIIMIRHPAHFLAAGEQAGLAEVLKGTGVL